MFENEYVAAVIGPKLLPLCHSCSSLSDLCSEFEKQWGFRLNRTKAQRWLSILGITPRSQTVFLGLQAEPTYNPVGVTPLEPQDVDLDAGFGGRLPDSFMQGAMPGGVFANVDMPGFKE